GTPGFTDGSVGKIIGRVVDDGTLDPFGKLRSVARLPSGLILATGAALSVDTADGWAVVLEPDAGQVVASRIYGGPKLGHLAPRAPGGAARGGASLWAAPRASPPSGGAADLGLWRVGDALGIASDDRLVMPPAPSPAVSKDAEWRVDLEDIATECIDIAPGPG